jgi:hypothetical protein
MKNQGSHLSPKDTRAEKEGTQKLSLIKVLLLELSAFHFDGCTICKQYGGQCGVISEVESADQTGYPAIRHVPSATDNRDFSPCRFFLPLQTRKRYRAF